MNGPAHRYRENGQLEQEGRFKNGKQDGEWRAYDDAGRVLKASVFVDRVVK